MYKMSAWMKTLSAGLTILLILAALSAGLAEQAASTGQPEGFDWQMTIAELMATGGQIESDDATNQYERDNHYMFRGEQCMLAVSSQCREAYAANLLQMTVKYGAPANMSAEAISRLFNELMPGKLYVENLDRLTTWILDDGTLVALCLIGEKCFTSYFNASLILDGK
ncbi:MAG: hypothetical protein JW811_04290 [Clostridiales bacterium]|nr:hypothetical protein [Clostridiales bacterium]